MILTVLAVLLTKNASESTNHEAASPADGFVLISAGTFSMGASEDELGSNVDEWPKHSVTLANDFYIQATEVTNQQFYEMLQWAFHHGYCDTSFFRIRDAIDGSIQELHHLGRIDYSRGVFTVDTEIESFPVKVSWYGAVAYCDWLSLREGLPRAYDHEAWECNGNEPYNAQGYRLPTEAEWEYACRAGSKTAFANGPISVLGKRDPILEKIGWHHLDWPFDRDSTQPVGQLIPNPWGLYDMHGNLEEWCNDWFAREYYGSSPESNPEGPEMGEMRVLRGGGWSDMAWECRSASRGRYLPEWDSPDGTTIAHHGFGFRPVRTAQ